jgi:hypothetical protein
MPPRLPEKKKRKSRGKFRGKKTQRHIEHRETISFPKNVPFQKSLKNGSFSTASFSPHPPFPCSSPIPQSS